MHFNLNYGRDSLPYNTAQMCIFIQMVYMTAKEELLSLLPMKECTRREFIFQSFKNGV